MDPEIGSEKGGHRGSFTADLIPGLTTAAVVVPKALAYATIAQLPVQAGLFAALVPMAVYAGLGSSRLLSVSTTTPIAILCATAIGEALHADPSLNPLTAAATLSVLVGAMLIIARLLRLGFLANFISEPVLTGFKAGVGLVIVVDQLPKLLGIHIQKEGFRMEDGRQLVLDDRYLALMFHEFREDFLAGAPRPFPSLHQVPRRGSGQGGGR